MLYSIIRPIARIAVKIFFRKIYFSNSENVPKSGPLIIASNHPTAYTEPVILATMLQQPLYFIVRGNLFVGAIYIKILKALQMLPIYRKEDGISNIKTNQETLDYCFKALEEKKTIMILAEGRTKLEKRLRPIQKGTARLALGAMDKYNIEDIKIVPVGVNFRDGDRFRSDVMIDFGEAISAKEYWSLYQENPNKSFVSFTDDLKSKMEDHIVIIDQPKDEFLTEKLFELERSGFPESTFPIIEPDVAPLKRELAISSKVNKMDPKDKVLLEKEVKSYFNDLEKNKIEDQGLLVQTPTSFIDIVKLVFGLPFFVIGLIFSFLPVMLAKFIVDKNTIRPAFHASGLFAFGMGLCFLFLLLLFVPALVAKKYFLAALILLIPAFGYFANLYFEFYQEWKNRKKVEKLDSKVKESLLEKRKAIKSKFFEEVEIN